MTYFKKSVHRCGKVGHAVNDIYGMPRTPKTKLNRKYPPRLFREKVLHRQTPFLPRFEFCRKSFPSDFNDQNIAGLSRLM